MNEILAFIDLLGFSQMVQSDHNKARRVLNDFYNISYRVIRDTPSVHGNLFSDSLLAHSANYPDLINCITEIYRECLRANENYTDLSFFLLPRGGISIGYLNIEERTTSPNLSKDFIVSPALVHSAKLEQSIKGSRLMIAIKKDDESQVSDIQWSNQIKSILYENSNYEFWENYAYADALWFLDLSKDYLEQKAEVLNLIEIAMRLTLANSNRPKILDQYINTLRIGLLSSTKFLDAHNDDFIQRIIDNFRDDKYWLIWMTLIEIIVNSGEYWYYASSRVLVSFIKNSMLKNGWAKMLDEINKPGQEYLLESFETFLQEMRL